MEEGLEAVLSRKQRATPAVAPIFDGEKEAKLILRDDQFDRIKRHSAGPSQAMGDQQRAICLRRVLRSSGCNLSQGREPASVLGRVMRVVILAA